MKPEEALPVIQEYFAPQYEGLRLRIVDDRICDRDRAVGSCPFPDSAKYTEFDAKFETVGSLKARLRTGGPLKRL